MLLNALEDCMLSFECDESYKSSSIKNRKRFYQIQRTLISVMLEIESEFSEEKYN